MRFITSSGEDTELLGEYTFCRLAKRYGTFLLYGEMGSGKTTFVRGFVRAAGYDGVRSPTFTMITVYPTRFGPIYHVDLYRLRGEEDFYTLGLLDVLGNYTVIVEWADKLPVEVDGVKVEISTVDESRRVIRIGLP